MTDLPSNCTEDGVAHLLLFEPAITLFTNTKLRNMAQYVRESVDGFEEADLSFRNTWLFMHENFSSWSESVSAWLKLHPYVLLSLILVCGCIAFFGARRTSRRRMSMEDAETVKAVEMEQALQETIAQDVAADLRSQQDSTARVPPTAIDTPDPGPRFITTIGERHPDLLHPEYATLPSPGSLIPRTPYVFNTGENKKKPNSKPDKNNEPDYVPFRPLPGFPKLMSSPFSSSSSAASSAEPYTPRPNNPYAEIAEKAPESLKTLQGMGLLDQHASPTHKLLWRQEVEMARIKREMREPAAASWSANARMEWSEEILGDGELSGEVYEEEDVEEE